jgi:hypothetical protein
MRSDCARVAMAVTTPPLQHVVGPPGVEEDVEQPDEGEAASPPRNPCMDENDGGKWQAVQRTGEGRGRRRGSRGQGNPRPTEESPRRRVIMVPLPNVFKENGLHEAKVDVADPASNNNNNNTATTSARSAEAERLLFKLASPSEAPFLVGAKGRNILLVRSHSGANLTVRGLEVFATPLLGRRNGKPPDLRLARRMGVATCAGGVLRWFMTSRSTREASMPRRPWCFFFIVLRANLNPMALHGRAFLLTWRPPSEKWPRRISASFWPCAAGEAPYASCSFLVQPPTTAWGGVRRKRRRRGFGAQECRPRGRRSFRRWRSCADRAFAPRGMMQWWWWEAQKRLQQPSPATPKGVA